MGILSRAGNGYRGGQVYNSRERKNKWKGGEGGNLVLLGRVAKVANDRGDRVGKWVAAIGRWIINPKLTWWVGAA